MLKNAQLPNSNDLYLQPPVTVMQEAVSTTKNIIQILITDAEEADPDSDRVLLVFTYNGTTIMQTYGISLQTKERNVHVGCVRRSDYKNHLCIT